MTTRPGTIPSDVVSLADYERHARMRLTDGDWAFVAGAGADGITRRWNREAFDAIALEGRALSDMRGASTATELFGARMDFPVMIAPVAFQKLAHRDGEIATVLGASAAGAWMTASTLASVSIEETAAAAATTLWFQLYMQPRRDDTLRLLRRAEAAGCAAVVVTVDVPVNGVRNEEQRVGFRLPAGVAAANLDGLLPPPPATAPGRSPVFAGLLDHAPRWDDIAWLRGETRLPLLLKGVVHPDDAEKALGIGVDGIIVSNHGGRALDTLPSSLDALERLVPVVRGRVPVLVDGGIRRGTDILKCLALGARAILVGQPVMHALAVGGAPAVAHMLTILRGELEVAMALTGCRTVGDIDRRVIWRRPG